MCISTDTCVCVPAVGRERHCDQVYSSAHMWPTCTLRRRARNSHFMMRNHEKDKHLYSTCAGGPDRHSETRRRNEPYKGWEGETESVVIHCLCDWHTESPRGQRGTWRVRRRSLYSFCSRGPPLEIGSGRPFLPSHRQ